MYATDNEWSQNIRILLEKEANEDSTETQRWTTFMLEAAKGHGMAVRVLIHHGTRLDEVNDDNRTALMLGINGHVNCVKTLIRCGASIDIKDKDDQSVLMLALKQGHRNIVRELMG